MPGLRETHVRGPHGLARRAVRDAEHLEVVFILDRSRARDDAFDPEVRGAPQRGERAGRRRGRRGDRHRRDLRRRERLRDPGRRSRRRGDPRRRRRRSRSAQRGRDRSDRRTRCATCLARDAVHRTARHVDRQRARRRMRSRSGDGLDALGDDEEVDEQLDARRWQLGRAIHLGERHRPGSERCGERRLRRRQACRASRRDTQRVVTDAPDRLLDELRRRIVPDAAPDGADGIDGDGRLACDRLRVVERIRRRLGEREEVMDLAMHLLHEGFVALRRRDRLPLDEHLAVEAPRLRDVEERRIERGRVDQAELVHDGSEEASGAHPERLRLDGRDSPAPERDHGTPPVRRGELEASAEAPVARVDQAVRERRISQGADSRRGQCTGNQRVLLPLAWVGYAGSLSAVAFGRACSCARRSRSRGTSSVVLLYAMKSHARTAKARAPRA